MNTRIEMVIEGLEGMDDAHIERYRDWITDKYADYLEGGISEEIGKRLENLAKRIHITV
jgi:hypothetical protein